MSRAPDARFAACALGLDDLAPIENEGLRWHPLRRAFGLTGFGAAVFSALRPADVLIEPHDELSAGAGGHEELYVVLRGRASFVVDDVELDAPTGTFVAVPPGARRSATAAEPETFVLVVGGRPGAALPVSPFEHWYAALEPLAAGNPSEAAEVASAGLADHPDHGQLHYQIACFRSLAGEHEAALDHLRRAIAGDARCWEWLADDADLDPLRGHRGFPRRDHAERASGT